MSAALAGHALHAVHAVHSVHSGVAGAAVMGLLTSVVAPLLVLLGRRRAPVATTGSRPVGAVGLLLGFATLHAASVLLDGATDGLAAVVAAHAALLAGAVAFWLPVLGRGATRLPDAGRAVYLFLSCPLLDAAALALVVRGEEPAGIAMVVAMLPVGLAAVVVTWRWVRAEERAADAAEGPVLAPGRSP